MRPQSGRFVKGISGNPAGRPRGSTNHAAELRRVENSALDLAVNTADIIAATVRMALTDIHRAELIPLFDAITGAAKEAIQDGEIGPSSVALLRRWFDDHHASDPQGGFFTHVDLPVDCSWADFKAHYTTRKRIDHRRHVEDLLSYPPIAEALAGAA